MTFLSARRGAAFALGVFCLSSGASAATNLHVCNETGSKVFFAMADIPDATKKWTLNAWWTVEAGNCRSVANIRTGLFYYYAEKEGRKIHWPAAGYVDKNFCVPGVRVKRELTGAFCAAGERSLGFRGVTSTEGKYTITLR